MNGDLFLLHADAIALYSATSGMSIPKSTLVRPAAGSGSLLTLLIVELSLLMT